MNNGTLNPLPESIPTRSTHSTAAYMHELPIPKHEQNLLENRAEEERPPVVLRIANRVIDKTLVHLVHENRSYTVTSDSIVLRVAVLSTILPRWMNEQSKELAEKEDSYSVQNSCTS